MVMEGASLAKRNLLTRRSIQDLTPSVQNSTDPCAKYCFERGYPPDSGHQHGKPPNCTGYTCANSCTVSQYNFGDGQLIPVCEDNFDPTCGADPACCCCGTGNTPCNGTDSLGNTRWCPWTYDGSRPGVGALPSFYCENGGGKDGSSQVPPTYSCPNPSPNDFSHGMFRDGTCVLLTPPTAPYGTPNYCQAPPPPPKGSCSIASAEDCNTACAVKYPGDADPADHFHNYSWVASYKNTTGCECYVAQQGFRSNSSYQKFVLSDYACPLPTTSPATTTGHGTTTSSNTTGPPGLSNQEVVEIAVGTSAGVVVLAAVILTIVFCRRRRQRQRDEYGKDLREPLHPVDGE